MPRAVPRVTSWLLSLSAVVAAPAAPPVDVLAALDAAVAAAEASLRAGDRDQAAVHYGSALAIGSAVLARLQSAEGDFAGARAALRDALKADPTVRGAHLQLGLVALEETRRAGIDEAVAEFRAELALAPDDPVASLELGAALVQHERFAEALPFLERASLGAPPSARALAYLGRAQLGLERPREAAASLQKALAAGQSQGANRPALLAIHLHLGNALERLGRKKEAERHFAESKRLSALGTDAERAQLARYLAGPDGAEEAAAPAGKAEREALKRRVSDALARSYSNLGVLRAQAERFDDAAALFEKAAALDPAFPHVQASLGVAYFNARRFDRATAPLARAAAAEPGNAGLKRMLALAWLNTGEFARAADALGGDPGLDADPGLLFAYGLALVKSNRAAEAEPIFARLLAENADSPELNVLIGQAEAQQGDFDAATAALQRALRLKPGVPEANAALGVIYLRQGRMAEAEQALRAELAVSPSDLRSRHNLAVVLDAQQRSDEALVLLRAILAAEPETADARYLAGKILLAQGATAEAVTHLEAAARLAPADAAAHYQLGQAYQKLGRPAEAQEQFETFRRLKDKAR